MATDATGQTKPFQEKQNRRFCFRSGFVRPLDKAIEQAQNHEPNYNLKYNNMNLNLIKYGHKYKKKKAFSKKQLLKFNTSTIYFLSRYTYPFKYVVFKYANLFIKPPFSRQNIWESGCKILRKMPFNFTDQFVNFWARPHHSLPESEDLRLLRPSLYGKPRRRAQKSEQKTVGNKLPTVFEPEINEMNCGFLYQERFKIYTNFITNEMFFNLFQYSNKQNFSRPFNSS